MEWIFVLPAAIVLIIVLVMSRMNRPKRMDPQYLVASVCETEYDIIDRPLQVIVRLADGSRVMLRLSSYKGTIDKDTKVILVKYEESSNSYKVERYE